MQELIERLERAASPDRQLDLAIFCALDEFRAPFKQYPMARISHNRAAVAPAFTESIDAALTLVPEGWTVANLGQNDRKGWWAELREGHQTSYNQVVLSGFGLRELGPAIALCTAALKARLAHKTLKREP